MKKLFLTAAAVAALVSLAACGAQTQAPQTDDEPETVIVYKDGNGNDQSNEQAAANQNAGDQGNAGNQGGGGGSQGGGSQGGAIIDDDADDNMRAGQQLPADFPVPVPDEYQVQAVGSAGNETSAVLRVPSGEDAYNYYRQALVNEGFQVEDEGSELDDGVFDAGLEFYGSNFEGSMDFSPNTVEIDIERYR